MKAAVWHARGDLRVERIPDPPAPGPNEITMKVSACGICRTDLEEYQDGPLFISAGAPHPLTGHAAPVILGHEFAGEVVAVGKDVQGIRVGDRVAPDVVIYCGRCFWCTRHQYPLCEKMAALGFNAHGGLADYCNAPVGMCVKLSPELPIEHAALAEPLSVAVRGIRKGRVSIGENVAIFGGGTVGLFALQVALQAGVRQAIVVDPLAHKRDLALQLGATAALDPHEAPVAEALRELTGGIGPDVVVEASGAVVAGPMAVEAARKGGRTVIVGLPVAPATLNFLSVASGEKEIIGSLAHVYDEDYVTAVHLLNTGRVKAEPLISDRIGLDDVITKGLNRLANEPDRILKILVKPG